jgi:hypothetical protein
LRGSAVFIRGHAWRQQRQHGRVPQAAGGERKLIDVLRADIGGPYRCFGLKKNGVVCDVNHLLHFSKMEQGIDRDDLSSTNFERPCGKRAEAGRFHLEAV